MSNNNFTITEEKLAQALEITSTRLDEIIVFFEFDPDDEWDLRENNHFIYINRRQRVRLFSQCGAFAIAQYMETVEQTSILERIIEFVTKHKEQLRNAFVRQCILDNSSSLIVKNNRHFLSKRDVVNILATSPARLNQAFIELQSSENVLKIYEDFDNIDGIRFYSLSGFYKIAQELAKNLKDKDRKAWCIAVEIVGRRTFKLLIDAESAKNRRIESAMQMAKRRDKYICQITGNKRDGRNRINMEVHHIYSKRHYPHLATSLDNLVTLTEEVHENFHGWNGGVQQPCTLDDLINFVNQQYPENSEISLKLNNLKKVFGNQNKT